MARLAPAWSGVLLKPDDLDQVLDSQVGQGEGTIRTDAVDPNAVLHVHIVGDVAQPPSFVPTPATIDVHRDAAVLKCPIGKCRPG